MTRDNWTCQRPKPEGGICGRSLEEEGARPQVGHIVAKSLGGKSDDSNLRAECGDCNQSNGNGLTLENHQLLQNRGRNWWKKPANGSLGFFSLKSTEQVFQRTYCSYPVHVAEDDARVEWRNAVARWSVELSDQEGRPVSFDETAEKILGTVRVYAISDAGRVDGLRKGWNPPYFRTWLKAGQYKDDPRHWQKNGHSTERIAEAVAGADDF